MPALGPDSSRNPTIRSVSRLYYILNGLFTLSASIIWGVNTLFLLGSGLNIFWVFAVNATFSAGQIVFEIPTGVIADTIGRRASFLIGIASLMVATLGYVGTSIFGWGIVGFILFSVLLGFGFTCQTGAVDAWMVDALDSLGYSGSKDRVFARSGVFTGVAMLLGTVAGGLLGQLSLTTPYYVRSGLLAGAFILTFVYMHEIGFQPRPLRISRFGQESRRVFGVGIRYGWQHPVVRPLLFTSLAGGLLLWYLFYASQPYALQLLGRGNLVWVAGAVTALFALSGVVGNMLVAPISRSSWGRRPARVLVWAALGMAVSATFLGAVGLVIGNDNLISFVLAVVSLTVFGMLWGLMEPVRNAYINEYIPSTERATVLSFDSFFSDIGAVVGQLGLGYGAQAASKALAYAVGGGIYFVAAPLYRLAGRASDRLAEEGGMPPPTTADALEQGGAPLTPSSGAQPLPMDHTGSGGDKGTI